MANQNEEHVLVAIYKDNCPACEKIKTSFQVYEKVIRDAKIGVRAVRVKLPIDVNIFPIDLKRFSEATPTWLLVRGDIWKEATSRNRLGSNNPIKFDTSVGLDIVIKPDGTVDRPNGRYASINTNDENEILKWVREKALKELALRRDNIPIPRPTAEVKVSEIDTEINQLCSNVNLIRRNY